MQNQNQSPHLLEGDMSVRTLLCRPAERRFVSCSGQGGDALCLLGIASPGKRISITGPAG